MTNKPKAVREIKNPEKEAVDNIYNQLIHNLKMRITPLYKPKDPHLVAGDEDTPSSKQSKR